MTPLRLTRRLALTAPLLGARAAVARPRRITLVSGAPPGSSGALWVQGFAPFLERHWPGVTVAVRGVPGDRGLAAIAAVAAAPADASFDTLGVVVTPFLLARAIEAGAQGVLESLEFIGAVVEEPVVLVAAPRDTPDFAPLRGAGPAATLATPPAGTGAALAARMLAARGARVDLLPFATAAAARKAVTHGSVRAAMLALPEAILALREGQLAPVAVAAAKRTRLLPDTPTLAELSLPVVLASRRGIVAPRGAATAAVAAALAAAVVDPEFVAQADEQGWVPYWLDAAGWAQERGRQAAGLAPGAPRWP